MVILLKYYCQWFIDEQEMIVCYLKTMCSLVHVVLEQSTGMAKC